MPGGVEELVSLQEGDAGSGERSRPQKPEGLGARGGRLRQARGEAVCDRFAIVGKAGEAVRAVVDEQAGPDPLSWTLDQLGAEGSRKESKCHVHDRRIRPSSELRRSASSRARARRSPRIAQGPRDLRPDASQLGRPGRPRRRRTPGPDLRRGGPACVSSKRRTEAPRGARDPEKSRGGCCVTPPDPSGSPGTLGVMSGQRFISGSRDQAFLLPPDMREWLPDDTSCG